MSIGSVIKWGAGVVVAVVAGVTGFGPSNGPELKAGDDAPSFALPGSDGKTYRLSDYKGKSAVVLAWFPKAFTGG